MQLWNSKARRIPNEILGRVIPIEILYEFDWPITFTFQCELGTFLAHLVTVDDRGFRHIAVPAKESDVAKLKNGSSSVRMAFDQPLVWVFECDPEWRVQFAATVPGIEYLPDGWVPAEGVILYPDLEPLLNAVESGG